MRLPDNSSISVDKVKAKCIFPLKTVPQKRSPHFRHVYFPLGGSRHGTFRQLLATMVCYLFVFVWHGGTMYMFVWAGLNFVDIMIEAMAKLVSSWPPFIQFEVR